jgi:hypothetical protein
MAGSKPGHDDSVETERASGRQELDRCPQIEMCEQGAESDSQRSEDEDKNHAEIDLESRELFESTLSGHAAFSRRRSAGRCLVSPSLEKRDEAHD